MNIQENERRPKKKKNYKGLFLAFVFLGVYIFLQMYLVNANKVTTIKATEGYINDSIISQGIVCREESILFNTAGGVVDYLVNDGERVSKGSIVANTYPSYSDIEKIIYLRNRQDNLDDINAATGYIDGNMLDISQTRKQLTAQMAQLAHMYTAQNYGQAMDDLTEITLSLNKIGVVIGRINSFANAKSQLENEINTVSDGIQPPLAALYTPHTGYFIKNVDGYEDIATVSNIVSKSYEEGMEIIEGYSSSPDNNRYGKIVTDYKWCICTYVDTDLAQNLKEGKTISISLKINDNIFNKATVEKIVDLGDKSLVVIECTVMDEYSASVRITDCEVLFKQYKGIKIPKSAIHFIDGQMGVYVNFSNIVYFKKISPTFEDDNYVIVPKTTNDNNQVEMYDSIIVKGRNLYDGKYL